MRPTFDVTDVFAAERLEREGVTSATLTAPGSAIFLPVPTGQTWLLYAAVVSALITTVGDVCRLGVGVRMAGESMLLTNGPTYTSGGVAAGPFEALDSIIFERPWVLRAGDAVYLQVIELVRTPPSISGTVNVRIARFGPESSSIFA